MNLGASMTARRVHQPENDTERVNLLGVLATVAGVIALIWIGAAVVG